MRGSSTALDRVIDIIAQRIRERSLPLSRERERTFSQTARTKSSPSGRFTAQVWAPAQRQRKAKRRTGLPPERRAGPVRRKAKAVAAAGGRRPPALILPERRPRPIVALLGRRWRAEGCRPGYQVPASRASTVGPGATLLALLAARSPADVAPGASQRSPEPSRPRFRAELPSRSTGGPRLRRWADADDTGESVQEGDGRGRRLSRRWSV
jgi:hypothetical protein